MVGSLNQEWEQLEWIGQDGYVAFGDAAIPLNKLCEALRKSAIDDRVINGTDEGAVAVAALTDVDDDVPVEILRDEGGFVSAVRLCWTNDVDQLDVSGEGAWQYVTDFPMESDTCLAWDPYHGTAETGVFVELAPSRYALEAFYIKMDCLGLRLIQEGSSGGERVNHMEQAKGVPPHQGWFDEDPPDPNLETELLLIERSMVPMAPGASRGHSSERRVVIPSGSTGGPINWTADAKVLWDYFADRGGCNKVTWEIGFLRIAAPEKTPEIAAYFNEQLPKDNPFGQAQPVSMPQPPVGARNV